MDDKEKDQNSSDVLKENKLATTAKLYLIPAFILFVFVMVLILVVVPKIQTIVNDLNEINDLNKQKESLELTINQVVALNKDPNLQSNLNTIRALLPSENEDIVDFRNNLVQLAEMNGLTVLSQTYRELIQQENTTVTPSTGLSLKEVPVEFEASGSLEAVNNFIGALSSNDDLVVIKAFSLGKSDENAWLLSIGFAKYQILETPEAQNLYGSVSPSVVIDPEVLDYITP